MEKRDLQINAFVMGCESPVEQAIAKLQAQVKDTTEKETKVCKSIAMVASDFAGMCLIFGDLLRKWKEHVNIRFDSTAKVLKVSGSMKNVNACFDQVFACFHELKEMNQRRVLKTEPFHDQIKVVADSNSSVFIVEDPINESIDIYAKSQNDLTEIDRILHSTRGPGDPTQSVTSHSLGDNKNAQRTQVCAPTSYDLKGLVVHCYQADILSLPVECIVNAANKDLQHGGGIALAISAAAGKQFQESCSKLVQTSKTFSLFLINFTYYTNQKI